MRLPIIKQLVDFVEEKDADFLYEAIDVLEHLSEVSSLKDEELDVIGELLSNMYGALEAHSSIVKGTPKKQAISDFMGRVLGSIDR